MTVFRLQFPRAEIPTLAKRYIGHSGEKDRIALESGARLRSRLGAHDSSSREDLMCVIDWKSHRKAALFKNNTDEELFEAIDTSYRARHERTAVAVLRGLEGAEVPMASAILTAMQPPGDGERYTIIDYHALRALGAKKGNPPIWYYLEYLDYCVELKCQTGHSLRTIDRALWQWSIENP